MRAERHPHDAARLAALREYGILDTPREPQFDDIVALASRICETPVALVTLLDERRQWFKAAIGTDLQERPYEESLCSHALLSPGLLEVHDLTEDVRFADNSVVTESPNLRFYAGVPLETPDGLPIGTLCVLDLEPRTLTDLQRETLRFLGRQAMAQMELRRQLAQGEAARGEVEQTLDLAGVATWSWDAGSDHVHSNPLLRRFFGIPSGHEDDLPLLEFLLAIHPDDRERVSAAIGASVEQGTPYETEYRVSDAEGQTRWVIARGQTLPGTTTLAGVLVDVTARKAAEAALEVERKQFRRLLDEVPAHIVTMQGPELRYDFANREFLRYLGRTDDFLGLRSDEAWPVPDEHLTMLRNILVSGEAVNGSEVPVLGPDGSSGFFDFAFQPLRDPEGGVTGVFVHSLDVTEKVLARRRLAESEERFRIVAQATRDAVWDWDLRTNAVWWNEGIAEMLGHDQYEPTADWWIEHIHPEDRRRVGDGIHAAIEARFPRWSDEYRYLRADGTYVTVQDRGFAVFDEAGTPVRMVGAMVDVTEERRQTRNDAFLRDLTEALIDRREPDDIIRTAERMLGEHLTASRVTFGEFEADEDTFTVRLEWGPEMPVVAGRHRLSIFGDRVVNDLCGGVVEVVRDVELEFGGAAAEVSRSIEARAGITVPVLREGRLASIFVVHNREPRDWKEDEVSLVRQVADRLAAEIERSRSEAALREANETLEERVSERTAELRESIEEAERFNYSISHDLRTPLRAISATSQMLLEEAGPELVEFHRELLERQAHNARRLGLLIDQLLRLSRLGRVEMVRNPLDMTEMARSVAEEIGQAEVAENCVFEIQEGMKGQGDHALVRLVLSNLLENAVKFSKGQGTIRVGQNGNEFSVSDDGVGFDMRYAPKLFLPFERLVKESEFPGTGIGLANVERIIRRHGGHIWAESVPGEGATFTFTLAP